MARTDAKVAYYSDLFGANNITGLTFSGSDLFCVVFVEGTPSVNVANMTCDVGGTSLPQVLAETATLSGRKIRAWAGTVTGTGTKTVQIGGSSLGSGILTIIATAHNGVSAVRGTPVAAFNSITASPSVTISGTVSGDECMMLGMSATDGNIIATSPAAEIAFTPSQATYYVLLEQAASGTSTTIAGTWTGGGSQAYEVVGIALAGLAPPAPTLSSPTTVSTGNGIATVRVTTDTAPTGSSILAVRTRAAAAPAWTATEVLASPTQTITSGASGARDFNLTGLVNGTALVADFAQTGPSNVVSTTSFTPSTVPGAPTIGTAVAGNAQATVNGTAPASNGGSAILEYRSTSTPASTPVLSATLPITHTGIPNGTAHTFTLAARNANGWGPESAASNSVTPTAGSPPPPPPAPAALTLAADDTGTVGVAGAATVSNTGGESASWSLSATPAGLTATPSSGTTAPGATTNISLAYASAATFALSLSSAASVSGSPQSIVVSAAPTPPPPPPPPPAPGFDFHTAPGCVFGAISGSLVGLEREVGVSILPLVYSRTAPYGLVATLPATATDSAGRLPRLTSGSLSAGTNYRIVFVWPDGREYAISMVATS